MWCSVRTVLRRGWKPFLEPSRQKVDVQEWINAHRQFDKMLYEMMPSSFVEFQGSGYPKELAEGKEGLVVNHAPDPMGLVMKEFFTPFFAGRLVTPMVDELKKMDTEFGATKLEQDEKSIKYSIDVKAFDPEAIKIRLVGEMLKIHALEEHKEEKDGTTRSEKKEMTKSFLLPRGVHKDDIKTSLSEDGILSIVIPKPEIVDIPIEKGEPLKIEHEDKKAHG
eukprot:TRINITY_DN14703_c0_g1_i1.p2 TRINITY_DN14703_c0_g1~~TRINITY_DN14703_c0_g1_i1.p2  ORF type:complete len:222 (+),score=81.28 TRINITY_DN14703_c0_g1_i1:42-707(+)